MALTPVDDFTIAERVQALYIAYFDRPAEPGGLVYWRDRYLDARADGQQDAAILTGFASEFANVGEARDAYPFLAAPDATDARGFVEAVFQALFDRLPEGTPDDPASGYGFWVARFTALAREGAPIGDAVLSVMTGARNADRTLVANKIAAADAFTERATEEEAGYDPTAAREALERVTAEMTAQQARLAATQPEAAAITATVEIEPDDSFAGKAGAIEASAREALDLVLAYLDPEPGNIELRIEAGDTTALATGGSTYFRVDAGPDGGVPSVLAHQLATGTDRNGESGSGSADVTITLSRERIDSFDFGDGAGDFDAVNIFAHELIHGLGVSSFTDDETDIMTVWDQYLETRPDGSYVFTGPNAVAANGGEPVPLDGPAHLSETVFTTALMTPKAEFGGNEQITDLDVALLRDLGLPMADGFEMV